MSYCAIELEVSGPKSVVTGGEVENRDVPPLTVASLHVKTHVNPSSHTNEIIAAGVVSLTGVKTFFSQVSVVLAANEDSAWGLSTTMSSKGKPSSRKDCTDSLSSST